MRRAWPVLAVAVLLASGCLEGAESGLPLQEADPASAQPSFAGVAYRCPGGAAASEDPCGAWAPAFADHGILDVAFRDDPPLIAAVGARATSGLTPAGPVEPGLSLLASADGGATWSQRPLPTVPSANTRTGTRAPAWADAAFTPDGRLHLLLTLYGDTERHVIGGQVPDQLQSQYDVAVVTTADAGATWEEPVTLSDAPAASYYAKLTALGDGTLFATWTDYPGADLATAWSGDGAAWTLGGPVRGDCREPSHASMPGGRVLVACLTDIGVPDETGAVLVFEADLANGTVARLEPFVGEPPADPESDDQEDLPGCERLQLHRDAGRLLAVLSGCPDIQAFSSADGAAWGRMASFQPETLGLPDGWGSGSLSVQSSAIDAAGMLHVMLWADRAFPATAGACACTETRMSHDVLDPASGMLMRDTPLGSFRFDDPATLATWAAGVPTFQRMHVGFHGAEGWMVWHDDLTRFGYIDVQTAPAVA